MLIIFSFSSSIAKYNGVLCNFNINFVKINKKTAFLKLKLKCYETIEKLNLIEKLVFQCY